MGPQANRRFAVLLPALVAGAVLAAYFTSLTGQFVYDDIDAVAANPTLGHFLSALHPPLGTTVSGRPVLNLSFALNHALSGAAVWSYHGLNGLIHAGAALALLGIVRRTLPLPKAGGWDGEASRDIAFAVSLLWAVHPLQVESVAYIVQRAESLMGLFYLLALYSFIRWAAGGGPAFWAWISGIACVLGMGCKEVMATAPLAVLFYDRTFVSGSFGAALRARKGYYLGLAASWIPLAWLVAGTSGRAGTAGFGSGVPWWAYLFTQFKAVALYLRLSFWPAGLVGDYGRILEGHPGVIAGCAVLVLGLAAWALWLAVLGRGCGYPAALFFLILAPSSSVIPVSTEIIAEHRMYLPLACVIVLALVGLHRLLPGRGGFLGTLGVLALTLGALTWGRVAVYRDSFTFWSDVARKVPANAGAWNNLGLVLEGRGDLPGAQADYRRALAVAPDYAFAHFNYANALAADGKLSQAEEQFEAALRFRPDDPAIHLGYGNALVREGRLLAGAAQFRAALAADPGSYAGWFNLADALSRAGNLPEAARAYAEAVRLRPGAADARVNLAGVLTELGRPADAVEELQTALRLDPGAADVHDDLGGVLAGLGRWEEARAQFEEALRLDPGYAPARGNLERLRLLEARKGTGR